MSARDAKPWSALRQLRAQGQHVRRQVPIGPFYADFVSHRAKLVIEVDGQTHLVGGAEYRDALRTERLKD
ncbi:endonuclease domain-containing protein [Devosia sp. XJ19-1]|uniref:Endonuclease domain-containing protein n=2 Tax=Devosia ureilytica TaxID=2952754 RepID=A0A9Q4FS77_9HYPH|nr:endonuclease domain-containing protein [Devosia ureilytica]MCP8886913.1 endonuclease domain-containing protein [Devosia ureilytica]